MSPTFFDSQGRDFFDAARKNLAYKCLCLVYTILVMISIIFFPIYVIVVKYKIPIP